MTIRQLYRKLIVILRDISCEAEAEAQEILAHVYDAPWSALIMRFFHVADKADEALNLARKRASGPPLAYVLGHKNFYGREYLVDKRVLIPRFDTECVAEAAVGEIQRDGMRVVDLCCGSGCIGITLLLESRLSSIVFSDISRDALDVAKRNYERLAPGKNASFVCADFLSGLRAPVDLIVCNPPYIAEEDMEALEDQVRLYEPALALSAPLSGLYYYKRLAEEAERFLTEDGILIAETGDNLSEKAAELFEAAGWDNIETGCDLSGMPRFIRARKGS